MFRLMTMTLAALALWLLLRMDVVSTHQSGSEIKFKLYNNSVLPEKVTVISYTPGRAGNSTEGFLLMPYASRKLSFYAGTKLYLADSQQVDTVMDGKRLTGKPWHVVQDADEGKTFNLKQ